VAFANAILAHLPNKDRVRWLALCEQVPLVFGEVLYHGAKPIRHVYFPVEGFISLVTVIDRKPIMEVGMVGSEGMLGVPLVLGVLGTPLHAVVQGSGSAWRIGRVAFRRELARDPALERILLLYVHVSMSQLASSAACLSLHLIRPRLARWLLMTQDRAHSENFKVTHEFLAYMLGVRRVGITTAAAALQRSGLIRYRRGNLTVLNRRGLEAAACGCYAMDSRAYTEILG
jgi:CRP-like cAMP-binding protein